LGPTSTGTHQCRRSQFRSRISSGGHSSAGRAPALQAGGHRFESGCLHKRTGCLHKRVRGVRLFKLYRGKVTRSWRRCSHRRTALSTLIAIRIGDFVLCQGESGSGASLGACDGSGTLSCVRPVVRLMSDRESVSGGSTPQSGVLRGRGRAPKSDSEGSEAFV
jgi:hypothetical protein